MAKHTLMKGPNKAVCDVLTQSGRPLGAYEILERVKVKGFNGPPTIYRALDKLIKLGIAHRIASKHAYVLCNHEKPHEHESIIFAICNDCDNVDEIPNKALYNTLHDAKTNKGFRIENEVVEVMGLCKSCSEQKGAC